MGRFGRLGCGVAAFAERPMLLLFGSPLRYTVGSAGLLFHPQTKYPSMIPRILGMGALLLWCSTLTWAQAGGRHVYGFLNLPQSARINALGGHLLSVQDDDGALAWQNPAALNADMHGQIAVSHAFQVADIDQGAFSYAHAHGNWTHWAGAQYITYGDMPLTNVQGQVNGAFSAGEYALALGSSYRYSDRITLGASLKWVNSRMETYGSWGLLGDLAVMYSDTARDLSMSFVVKHLGAQVATYGVVREQVPFDVRLGISKRLAHLPFRYSVTLHSLQRWDIRYDDPNADTPGLLFGEAPIEEGAAAAFADILFHHIVLSGEFLLGRQENLRLRLAYNHQRRSEMMVDNTLGMMGFSLGFGVKVNRFRIDYGRSILHLAGNNNQFSISTHLSAF